GRATNGATPVNTPGQSTSSPATYRRAIATTSASPAAAALADASRCTAAARTRPGAALPSASARSAAAATDGSDATNAARTAWWRGGGAGPAPPRGVPCLDERHQAPRVLGERRSRSRRDRQHDGRGRARRLHHWRHRGRRRTRGLQEDVRVGPADAEGADTDD